MFTQSLDLINYSTIVLSLSLGGLPAGCVSCKDMEVTSQDLEHGVYFGVAPQVPRDLPQPFLDSLCP